MTFNQLTVFLIFRAMFCKCVKIKRLFLLKYLNFSLEKEELMDKKDAKKPGDEMEMCASLSKMDGALFLNFPRKSPISYK